jgi:hypothetical protein
MTNKYVFVLEIQQLLYSSQEKSLLKKITKRDLPPHCAPATPLSSFLQVLAFVTSAHHVLAN